MFVVDWLDSAKRVLIDTKRLSKLFFLCLLTLVLITACHHRPNLSASGNASLEGEGRLVTHAMGQTLVPPDPQRVVNLDPITFEMVLALGSQPVGAPSPKYTFDQLQLASDSEAILDVRGVESADGFGSFQPNLEKVLTLKPDLILGMAFVHKRIYRQLSQIAPTVLLPGRLDTSASWRDALDLVGEALGKPEAVQKIIVDYDTRLADFQTRMGTRLAEIEVSVARIYPDLSARLLLRKTFAGEILAHAGLARPPAQSQNRAVRNITKERFADADGDAMFIVTHDDAKIRQALKQQIEADPLWSQLPVVKRGNVYAVGDYWTCCGPLATNRVVDDLFEYLVGELEKSGTVEVN